jgi:glycosyltransferase involved in cell wall biosynthesis
MSASALLAYDVFGNHEYLIDGYTGYMVERNNPQAMAEKLVQIMRDRPQREAVRARGIDFMQKTFSGGVAKFKEIKEFLDL